MADQKKYLRRLLGECRASLTREFARVSSTAIQRRLMATDCYRAARAIALYSPVHNEVATAMVAADAIASGKKVLFPRLGRDRAALAMVRVHHLSELVSGAHGISEPHADGEVVAPSHLAGALVVVPGVAFGPQGQRLGRGGGHYDRFIAALPREAITVGLGYSFQLLDGIPLESHDRRLHYVITESALIRACEPQAYARAEEAGRGGTPG